MIGSKLLTRAVQLIRDIIDRKQELCIAEGDNLSKSGRLSNYSHFPTIPGIYLQELPSSDSTRRQVAAG